jgi:PiT family inorganic phosphate transporter
MGAGSTTRLSAVSWGVTRRIVVAWVLTIPISAMIGAGAWYVLRGVGL